MSGHEYWTEDELELEPWTGLSHKLAEAERQAERNAGEGDRALARCRMLRQLSFAIDIALDREILRAHDRGKSFQALGTALNTTKQGAQHRYRNAFARSGRMPPPKKLPRKTSDLDRGRDRQT